MTRKTDLSLMVASYNIRAGLGTDLRRDPARTLATVAALQAQVVVLQEADFRLGHRPAALPPQMIADVAGLQIAPLDGHPDSLGWHGIALLTGKGITVTKTEVIDLPGLEPRGAIIAQLQTPIGPLRLAGVHLGLLRFARRRQLDHLRRSLAATAACPTLIIGDFNEWSVKRGLGRIARDFNIITPGRTFPSRKPMLALDRIAHSPDLDVAPQRLPPLPCKGRASDHLPVLAAVRPAPCPARGAPLPMPND